MKRKELRTAQSSGEIKMMKVKDIVVKEPFSQLFPIDPETLERIKEHMKTHGYDISQPVTVWDGIIVDGHSRLTAAVENEIKKIPIFEKKFANENEAVEYAIHSQLDRRNLTDGDILRLVEMLDKKKEVGRPKKITSPDVISGAVPIEGHLFDDPKKGRFRLLLDSVKRTSVTTAQLIGTSSAKVEKARAILARANMNPGIKQALINGDISLNEAYRKALKKRTSVTLGFGNGTYLTIKENDQFLLRKHLERIDWIIVGMGQPPDMKNFPKSELLCPKREK
jgi:hypothetical protein